MSDIQGSTGHVDAVPHMSHFQAFCEVRGVLCSDIFDLFENPKEHHCKYGNHP